MTNEVKEERDYVAEAEGAAIDWVRFAASCISSGASFPLERWLRVNPKPSAKGLSANDYAEALKRWRTTRRQVQLTAHDAVTFAFWEVLERAGYPREMFGAKPLPEFDVPYRLRGEWGTTGHHLRYATSRRFAGMERSIKRKRVLFLEGKARSEVTMTEDTLVPLADGGRLTRHADTRIVDGTTAKAEDRFEQAKRDGLLKGFIAFGLLTKDLGTPAPPPDPEAQATGSDRVDGGEEQAAQTCLGCNRWDGLRCERTNARRLSGTGVAPPPKSTARVTTSDGTVIELSPGASVKLSSGAIVEAVVSDDR